MRRRRSSAPGSSGPHPILRGAHQRDRRREAGRPPQREDPPSALHGRADLAGVRAKALRRLLEILDRQRETPEARGMIGSAGAGEPLVGLLDHLEYLPAEPEERLSRGARGRWLLA